MSKASYSNSSPYSKTPQTSWYLSHYKSRSIIHSGDDTLYTVSARYEYRPDLLSYDVYGTVGFWWVFMKRNMDVIKDPIFDMKAGISIYIPQRDNII